MAEAGDIRAGGAFVELSTKADAFFKGMADAENRYKAFAETAKSIGMKMAAVGAAISGSMIFASKRFADSAVRMNQLSAVTGVEVETLSRLEHAARMSDVEFEGLARSMRFMNRAIFDATSGSKPLQQMFRAIGLDAAKLSGLSTEEKLFAIADAISSISDQGAKTDIAMTLMGRSSAEMMPFFNQGGDAIRAMMNEADALGGVMGGKSLKAALEYDDAMDRLETSLNGVKRSIGTSILPIMTVAADATAKMARAVSYLSDRFPLLTKAAFAIGAVMFVHGSLMIFASFSIGLVAKAVAGLNIIIPLLTRNIIANTVATAAWATVTLAASSAQSSMAVGFPIRGMQAMSVLLPGVTAKLIGYTGAAAGARAATLGMVGAYAGVFSVIGGASISLLETFGVMDLGVNKAMKSMAESVRIGSLTIAQHLQKISQTYLAHWYLMKAEAEDANVIKWTNYGLPGEAETSKRMAAMYRGLAVSSSGEAAAIKPKVDDDELSRKHNLLLPTANKVNITGVFGGKFVGMVGADTNAQVARQSLETQRAMAQSLNSIDGKIGAAGMLI